MVSYRFSTPMLYTDNRGRAGPVTVWTVFIAPKGGNGSEDYEFDDEDYTNLVETGIYDFMLDADENANVFESADFKLSSTDLFFRLKKAGMSHSSSLDKILEIWVAEKQKSNEEASKASVEKEGKGNRNFNPDFKEGEE